MSTSLEQKENDQLIAAEEAGFKFIELILNKSRVSRGQKEVRLAGVKVLKCYSKGFNDDGIEEWDFVKSSGQIKFKLDRKKRAYVGFLWDDDEKAIYHRKGYNRDFLASHIATGDFEIVAQDIKEDILKRREKMLVKLAEQEANKKENVIEKVNPKDDIDDLDKQIEFLQKRKELVQKQIEDSKPTRRSANRNPHNPINKNKPEENNPHNPINKNKPEEKVEEEVSEPALTEA